MDNKPVLFPKMYQWSYEEFLAECQKKLEMLLIGASNLEVVSTNTLQSSFTANLPYHLVVWENLAYIQGQCTKLEQDLQISPEEFAELKKESEILANRYMDLMSKGLEALKLTNQLISCHFWEKVKINHETSLPITVDIEKINKINLEEIHDPDKLLWAIQIIQEEFPEYRISQTLLITPGLFESQKTYIAKAIAIAHIIHELNKSNVTARG